MDETLVTFSSLLLFINLVGVCLADTSTLSPVNSTNTQTASGNVSIVTAGLTTPVHAFSSNAFTSAQQTSLQASSSNVLTSAQQTSLPTEVSSAAKVSSATTEPSVMSMQQTSPALTTVSPPGSPKSVSVQVINTTSLQLSWSAVVNVLYYRITCFECRSEVNLTSNATSYLLTGLTPGTNYTLGIASCSKDVCSTSNVTSSITYPGQPGTITVISHQTNSLRMAWNQSGQFDNFTVRVNQNSWPLSWNRLNSSIQAAILNLPVAGGQYQIDISAISMGVNSSVQTVFATTAPAQPGTIAVNARTINSLTVGWNQNGQFDDFTLWVNQNAWPLSWNRSNSSIQAAILNLPVAGGQYQIDISAISMGVNSSVQTVFATTAPAQPGTIAVNARTINSLTVGWNQNGQFDNFTLWVNQNAWPLSWNSSNSSVVAAILNLPVAGGQYQINISAISKGVQSIGQTVLAITAPAQPGSIAVKAQTMNSLTVTWNQSGQFNNFTLWVNQRLWPLSWNISNSSVEAAILNLPDAGGQYQIDIAAISMGVNSSVQTLFGITAPAQPGSIAVKAQTMNSLTVTWNQSGQFDNFTLWVNQRLWPLSWNSSNSSVEAVILNLSVAGGRYQIDISALSKSIQSIGQTVFAITAPAQPGIIAVQTRTTNSLTVAWNQSGQFDNFTIRVNQSVWPLSWKSSNSSIQAAILNLPVAGGQYQLDISAISMGVNSSVQTVFATTVPPQPGSVSCDTSSKLDVIIYSPPSNGSFVISSYSVMFIATSDGYQGQNYSVPVNFVMNNVSVSAKLNPVVSGVTYMVMVSSVAKDIVSEPKVITCTTAPNSVQYLRIVKVTNDVQQRNAVVSWNSPDGYFDRLALNCVASNLEAISVTQTYITRKDVSNYTFTSLTAGVSYNLSVATMVNSSASVPIVTTNLTLKPLPPPNNFIASSMSDSVISLNLPYSYPRSVSQCVNYQATAQPGDLPFEWPCSVSEYNFSGLNDSTLYTFTVFAESQQKLQSISPISVANRWTLPKPPTRFSTLPSTPNYVTLVWSSDGNRASISGYMLTIGLAGVNICSQSVFISCAAKDESSSCNSHSFVNNVACADNPMNYTFLALNPLTNYTVSVTAYNPGGTSVTQTLITATAPVPNTSGCGGGCVAGIVIGLLAALIIIVGISFYFWRSKHPIPKRMQRASIVTGSSNPAYFEEVDKPPSPVLVANFIEHVEDLHKDSGYKFSAEYDMLKRLSKAYPMTAAELPQNRVKNRYTNILPFDHSRVKLIPLDDDDEGSDYINASYVPGYFSKREFIASQGPMKCTLDDFWRMIWEQNVTAIVMLTNLQERNREKCECYWPLDSEPLYYGEVQVQVKSESSLGHYVIRAMEVKVDAKKRILKQMHFNSWPDFGCPKDVDQLLDFVMSDAVNSRQVTQLHYTAWPDNGVPLALHSLVDFISRYQSSNVSHNNPVLVHCSAGVGRTGTFIMIDRLLQQIQREAAIDVFGCTLEMRDYRCHMIQTEAQYVFTHDCIRTAIERSLQLDNNVNENGWKSQDGYIYENATEIADLASHGAKLGDRALPEGSDASPFALKLPRPQPAPRTRNNKDQTRELGMQMDLLDL